MAGDCGDEIPSKSKPQSAGVTSSTISEILFDLRCFSCNFVFETFTPVRIFHTFSVIFENFFFQSSLTKIPTSLKFLLPKRDTSYSHPRFSRRFFMFAHVILRLFFFQCSITLLLVFARPDDHCGSFFFFLKGNSFPSASTLSRTCLRAYPPRYCLPEISFPIELLAMW